MEMKNNAQIYIEIDNRAIRLGQRDRSWIKSKVRELQLLKLQESVHHKLHACAKVSPPTSPCFIADKAIEAEISFLVLKLLTAFKMEWSLPMLRPPFPVELHRCPVCHLKTVFKLKQKQIETEIAQNDFKVSSVLTGESLESMKWDYFLHATEPTQ